MGKFRADVHPYKEHEFVNVEDPAGLDCSVLPSRARQEFQEECDINVIAKRNGLDPFGPLPEGLPMWLDADFTNVTDFMGAHNLIREAVEGFAAMPADVRARFHNDPGEFMAFTSDAANFDEAARLGLVRSESVERRATEVKAKRDAEVAAAVKVELAAAQAAAKGTGST